MIEYKINQKELEHKVRKRPREREQKDTKEWMVTSKDRHKVTERGMCR